MEERRNGDKGAARLWALRLGVCGGLVLLLLAMGACAGGPQPVHEGERLTGFLKYTADTVRVSEFAVVTAQEVMLKLKPRLSQGTPSEQARWKEMQRLSDKATKRLTEARGMILLLLGEVPPSPDESLAALARLAEALRELVMITQREEA